MVVVACYQIMIEEIKILIENRCSFTHEESKHGIDRGKVKWKKNIEQSIKYVTLTNTVYI